MKILVLRRICYTPKVTLGELKGIVDGADFSVRLLCMTVEPPMRDNLPYESCIPEGEYYCAWSRSTKVSRGKIGQTLEVLKVPKRTDIQFHPGNTAFDTEGCILPVSRLVIFNEWKHKNKTYKNVSGGASSRVAFQQLMRWAGNSTEFVLRIINGQPELNILSDGPPEEGDADAANSR